ncbi:MAG TPA: hypothetical protein ENK43_15480 [Planctomycetes bacterium]|nr:hypothetical protein [Planctomycetota bacterium]
MNAFNDRADSLLPGPALIRAAAGTGKTTLLVERVRDALEAGPNGRFLVTSFSPRGLSELRGLLASALSPEALERITIQNLHPFAREIVAPRLGKAVLAKGPDVRAAWEEALHLAPETSFPLSFYREEWERVVQVEEIVSRNAYVKSRRPGRTQRLDRFQQLEVWEVLMKYRDVLAAKGLTEWGDLLREARLVFEEGHEAPPFAGVFADEAQEYRPGELRLLAALCVEGEKGLTLAADPRQRLWGFPVDLTQVFDGRIRCTDLEAPRKGSSSSAPRWDLMFANIAWDDLMGGSLEVADSPSRPVPEFFEDEAAEEEAVRRMAVEDADAVFFAMDGAEAKRWASVLERDVHPAATARGREADHVCLVGLRPEDRALMTGEIREPDEAEKHRLAKIYLALSRGRSTSRAVGRSA